MKIWKYNKATGYWVMVQNVSLEAIESYLKIFREDEPEEFFISRKNRPNHNPYLKGT